MTSLRARFPYRDFIDLAKAGKFYIGISDAGFTVTAWDATGIKTLAKKFDSSVTATKTLKSIPLSKTGGAYEPPPGSKERKLILDTLRVPVQKEVRQKVVFHSVEIRTKNGWAYVQAVTRDEKGKRLKRWAPQVDPMASGLLRQNGKKWRVLDWGASTDVAAVYDLRKAYPQAPRSIFPSLPDDFPGDGSYGGDGFNNRD
jgi:hypothetical protein